jgi:hypothetical protein
MPNRELAQSPVIPAKVAIDEFMSINDFAVSLDDGKTRPLDPNRCKPVTLVADYQGDPPMDAKPQKPDPGWRTGAQ